MYLHVYISKVVFDVPFLLCIAHRYSEFSHELILFDVIHLNKRLELFHSDCNAKYRQCIAHEIVSLLASKRPCFIAVP